MSTAGREQRKRPRAKAEKPQSLKISFDPGSGNSIEVAVAVVDSHDEGIGIELAVPLVLGSLVTLMGPLMIGGCRVEIMGRARVKWCKMAREGVYRAGLYLDGVSSRSSEKGSQVHLESSSGVDYYEILEVSPKASPDTIHRVYRILAQRYHPDNAETGDEEAFKGLLAAYRVLSGPEERAAYDVQRLANRQTRWKIFEHVETSRGLDAEKRKRHGILSLLYTKRVNDPDQPGMTLYELEDLLGCPREHLSFSLWYLKENNYVLRGDNGRVSITARGVDQAEAPVPWNQREDRLLAPAPTPSPEAAHS